MTAVARRELPVRGSLLPHPPFGLYQKEFANLLSRLTDWDGQWIHQWNSPSLDIAESPEAIEVTMDLPGMKAENLDVQVSGDRLTITGHRKDEREEQDHGKYYHRIERHVGHFSRTVSLPCEVAESKVDAAYENGVLKIRLPKVAGAKTHKIQVQEKK